MSKVGVIKTKLLKKLTESYGSNNKSEMKDILKTVMENKDFKEMYLFYEEFENKHIEDKETAKLYVEGVEAMLNTEQKTKLNSFCESLDKKLGNIDIEKNELYESLDQLSVKDSFSNIENKINAKKKLVEHLIKVKEINRPENSTYTVNESLLHTVLANNFNVLYNSSLNEEQKEQLKNILSIPSEELEIKTNELKESILNQVNTILTESTDTDLKDKLNNVKNEVGWLKPSRHNYYRLIELKNGLN